MVLRQKSEHYGTEASVGFLIRFEWGFNIVPQIENETPRHFLDKP